MYEKFGDSIKEWFKNHVGLNEIQISDYNLDLLLDGCDEEFNKVQGEFYRTGNLKNFLSDAQEVLESFKINNGLNSSTLKEEERTSITKHFEVGMIFNPNSEWKEDMRAYRRWKGEEGEHKVGREKSLQSKNEHIPESGSSDSIT